MTKGELNIATAELQQKVDRITVTRERALKTAAAAVDRKYKKQIQDLLETKVTCSTDGETQELLYPQEVVGRIGFPDFWTAIVQTELLDNSDGIEDLKDSEVIDA